MMRSSAYDKTKRGSDIALSILALVASAPIQAVVAILIWKKLGAPVLFRQARPGRDGQIFELIKFRSMLPFDAAKGLVSDEQRLTKFGRFLRSTSLDELPTLINVLRGEMSLVGPRPLLVSYLDRYTPEQGKRHAVRPGITGLAQVRGRNDLSWDQKFAYDIYYVDNYNLHLDVMILFATLKSVLLRKGITARKSATMPEFLGCEVDMSGDAK